MNKVFLNILLIAALTVSLVSCGDGSRVIPRNKLAEIYAEMFIMDQWISSDVAARRKADTTLVYEPIFEKYGYTSDDYRKSMEHYLEDPDRYARILRETTVIIEDKIKTLKKEKDLMRSLSEIQAAADIYRPEKIFFLSGLANRDLLTEDSLSFYVDSTGGEFMFDVQKGYDTLYMGPRIKILSDTLSVDSFHGEDIAMENADDVSGHAVEQPEPRSVMLKTDKVWHRGNDMDIKKTEAMPASLQR